MDDKAARRWKLEQKLRKIKAKTKNSQHPLFNECIESLGENTLIFSQEKSNEIAKDLMEMFPYTFSGKIDWNRIKKHLVVRNIDELLFQIKTRIQDFNEQVFVVWDNYEIPVISTNLDRVFQSIDDVDAVSFYYWIFNSNYRFVIEIQDEETIRIGFR
ncbi:hypothetical protein ACFDTO_35430 [Microbacteriaceae bacterium 4G12]